MPRPTTEELKVDGFDEREGRPWSPENDCAGCDGHLDGVTGHPEGGHRFGCSVYRAQQTRKALQLKIPVRE